MNKHTVLKNLIIKLLYKNNEMSGYDFIKKSKDNDFKISSGSVYPHLKSLLLEELVNYKTKGRKKVYFLTEKGIIYYNEIINNPLYIKKTINRLSLVINCNCEDLPEEIKFNMKEFLESLSIINWKSKTDIDLIINRLRKLDNSLKILSKGVEK